MGNAEPPTVHPVLTDNCKSIRHAALSIKGEARPSGMDADYWWQRSMQAYMDCIVFYLSFLIS